jgi:hypothetical protein
MYSIVFCNHAKDQTKYISYHVVLLSCVEVDPVHAHPPPKCNVSIKGVIGSLHEPQPGSWDATHVAGSTHAKQLQHAGF